MIANAKLKRNSPDSGRRAVSAEALVRLNDLDSADIAASVLKTESHPEVVTACLKLLGHLGHAGHLESVRPWLDTPTDAVRAAAFSALGGVGGSDQVPVLSQHVEDRSTWVALQAARGLLRVGGREPLEGIARGEGRSATVALQVLAE